MEKANIYVWVVTLTEIFKYDHPILAALGGGLHTGPDDHSETIIEGVFSSFENAEKYVRNEIAKSVSCEDDIHDTLDGPVKDIWYESHTDYDEEMAYYEDQIEHTFRYRIEEMPVDKED